MSSLKLTSDYRVVGLLQDPDNEYILGINLEDELEITLEVDSKDNIESLDFDLYLNGEYHKSISQEKLPKLLEAVELREVSNFRINQLLQLSKE